MMVRMWFAQVLVFFLSLEPGVFALQTQNSRNTNILEQIIPLPLISGVVAALQSSNLFEAVPIFVQEIRKPAQGRNTALPVAYKPFSDLSFCKDCITAQNQARRRHSQPSFLLEVTPSSCNLDPDDRPGQVRWLQENAQQLRKNKILHGAIYFRSSWSVFRDADGVDQACRALGLTPCRDPKEIRGPAPLLAKSTTIYETLNNPADAATHLGLHFEGIPGIMPTSALFSCFEPAQTGGEFLLCDGRRVFRDLDARTLANLENKRLRPTFANLPDWIADSPLPFIVPTELYRKLLFMFTDLTKPTQYFMLDEFPERTTGSKSSLKLTTHPAVPVLHHPITNEPVWFSGMDSGHRGNFQRQNPHLLLRSTGGKGSGRGKYASEVFDVRYGDGTEITEVDLANVREACERNTVALALQPGDAVFLDNFTVLHGRKPFVGTRKHTVVWFLD